MRFLSDFLLTALAVSGLITTYVISAYVSGRFNI